MLKSLHVENFALLNEIDVMFEPGLNIITGETGAGKSILIDALGSTIGEKIAAETLRRGAKKTVTECIFHISNLDELKIYLKQNAIENFDDDLILRKESSETGRNRAFVNDTPATNAALIDIGDFLIDLHGQHEHQALLKVGYHILYLDEFGGYKNLLQGVEENYNIYQELATDLKNLRERENSLAEKKELYQFQINELNNVKPKLGEEQELLQEEKILGNSEKIYQLSTELAESLYDQENSIYDRLSETLGKLDDLALIDSNLTNLKTDCEAAQVTIQETAKYLQSYSQNIEYNPGRLDEVRERLGHFSSLKRKYKRTIDEIIEYKNQIEQELQLIENLDSAIVSKQSEISARQQKLTQICKQLSDERKAAAARLEKLVLDHLSQLGMKNVKFRVNIEYAADEKGAVLIDGTKFKTSILGIDQVEFFISTNLGEDLKPLARVASGGEISRIMLALKSSLAEADKIPVLIFDEIDNGISGRIAQAVGLSLKKLAQTHQIICITHLPQIASVADYHFVVEKISNENVTYTKIRKLDNDERALEIAKLLGGEVVTSTHINSARELIEQARQMNIGS